MIHKKYVFLIAIIALFSGNKFISASAQNEYCSPNREIFKEKYEEALIENGISKKNLSKYSLSDAEFEVIEELNLQPEKIVKLKQYGRLLNAPAIKKELVSQKKLAPFWNDKAYDDFISQLELVSGVNNDGVSYVYKGKIYINDLSLKRLFLMKSYYANDKFQPIPFDDWKKESDFEYSGGLEEKPRLWINLPEVGTISLDGLGSYEIKNDSLKGIDKISDLKYNVGITMENVLFTKNLFDEILSELPSAKKIFIGFNYNPIEQ